MNGVKDNLVFLSNMATTQATLSSTRDTSNLKLISVLTAIFLPFTFMAVLLTTPMFKWHDPPEGKIIVKTPFIIWWAMSVGMILLTFLAYIILFVWKPCKHKDAKESNPPGEIDPLPAKPKPPEPPGPPAPPGGTNATGGPRWRKKREQVDLEGGQVTSEFIFKD